MKVLIAEASVSLVPDTWLEYPEISKYHKKYNRKPLIDGSKHQHLLKNLPLDKRQDRPDILHFGLLTALGYNSFFNEYEIYFSIKDAIYRIDPSTNIPRAQNRFYGILEQLLSSNDNNPFINKLDIDLNEISKDLVFFSSKANEKWNWKDVSSADSLFVFGGFAYGNFEYVPPSAKIFNLSDQTLELWTAMSYFLANSITNS